MIVKQVGTIKELPNGELDIRYWVIDGDYPPTEDEVQEMVQLAKQHGAYYPLPN